jgi:UDP-4-amino-4,6-dideoxy-N-acetyl-beta-L-altrosamine transaminase
MTIRYPYSRQWVTDADVMQVAEALQQPFLTQGPQVAGFEADLCTTLGARHAISCSNGTTALHLAYLAARLGPSRALITTPVTFLATANAARMLGATVLFADVDPATGNIDPDSVEQVIRHAGMEIGAITAVHLAGRPCDMVRLRAIADGIGCLLIEDGCHALGARYRHPDGREGRVGDGALADLSCFSFHAIKHVTSGEGGAVTTPHAAMAARMRLLRSHGIERDDAALTEKPEDVAPWYYEMHELGFNYRLPDVFCALGRSQLTRLEESLTRRREIAEAYRALLGNLRHVRLPPEPSFPEEHAWHLFPIAIDFAGLGTTRGQVMQRLAEAGIGTQVHYMPLYRHPYYRALGALRQPGADTYYEHSLSIPMYPQLTDSDLETIAAVFRRLLG